MGKLEIESKRNQRNTNLKKAILVGVKTAGLLGVALLAPNVIGILKDLGIDIHKRQKETINRSRNRLIQRGLLSYNKEGFVQLTKQGESELQRLERLGYKIPKPKRWDKKWRVLIFDIHETKKIVRDQLRATLVSIGFVRLQNSVWVFPYDCEDLTTLLKADFQIGKDLLYMIVDSIENDESLLRRFGLKR